MSALTAIIGIVALFLGLATWIARTEGLAFLAPKSTRAIRNSALTYCTDQCRVAGQCPLTHSAERADSCPLFKYVAADVPTVVYGSPFEAAT
jgi:hypothetical protein